MHYQTPAEEIRMVRYFNCNHTPCSTPRKYSFDYVNREFNNKEVSNVNGKVKIIYGGYFPNVCNSVFLCCANADKMNAGYDINHRITQEGQLFYDSDVFASELRNLYPFKFDKELLYVENVTFHNHEDWQIDINSFRKNDVIFAASKKLKQNYETDFIEEKLEKIIEAIFKIAIVKNKKTIYLWPLGCGVFKNNPKTVARIFAGAIKKHKRWFREIVMVIYDKDRKDKSFNTFFICALNELEIQYETK